MGPVVDAETGFQYLRARYYDPATGQFLTRDPIEAETREAYGYVGGNPLNGTDPSGLCWGPGCWVEDVLNEADDALDGIGRETADFADDAWDYGFDNPEDVGTAVAFATCLFPGLGTLACGATTLLALAGRSRENFNEGRTSAIIPDLLLTYATFTLVQLPSAGAFGELQGVLAAGERGILTGASRIPRGALRLRFTLPDLAGAFGSELFC